MLVATEKVISALPYPALIKRLSQDMAGDHALPSRQHVELMPGGGRPNAALLLMPGQRGSLVGLKTVTVHSDRSNRPGGAVRSQYMIFDGEEGGLIAILDAHELTTRRTAAQSALAALWLAAKDPQHMLVVGAGEIASALVDAYTAIFPEISVQIWARRPEAAKRLVEIKRNIQCSVATDLQAAALRADIVSTATTSHIPFVELDHLKPGAHLDLVGGFRPDMREATDGSIAAADVVVVDALEALQEAGDLAQPLASGALERAKVHTFAKLLTGRLEIDRSRLTIFKSVGSARADLAAASLLAEAGLFKI
jgi:ornithine cyclodeaminase